MDTDQGSGEERGRCSKWHGVVTFENVYNVKELMQMNKRTYIRRRIHIGNYNQCLVNERPLAYE